MKRLSLLLVALVNVASTSLNAPRPVTKVPVITSTAATSDRAKTSGFTHAFMSVYDDLNLEKSGLQRQVFEYALYGWEQIARQKPILSIVDMSQPSSQKRLYIIDLQNRRLLFNTYVSHGRNSGDLMASQFSNVNASFQSSLGFYKTLNTYMGKHGLSLQLKGLEKGFNDQVQNRNIVLHGADYVCEDIIKKTGRLGRSQGCPAVPYAQSKAIIQAVKGGTCLFVYSPNKHYLDNSSYLTGLPTT